MFEWVKKSKVDAPVTAQSVRDLLRRDYPRLITKECYQKPHYRPTRWAVLHGPCYGEKKFKGTLLIDLSQMLTWSSDHAKNTWTTQTLEQEAKEYFPQWLQTIDLETEAVTLLDHGQYGFLKDYYSEFVDRNWHQIYCPQCNVTYTKLNRERLNEQTSGKKLSWTIEWQCILGHSLYRYEESIKLF
jgi:hypothetical protein